MSAFIDYLYSLSRFEMFIVIIAIWSIVFIPPLFFVRSCFSKTTLMEGSDMIGYGLSTVSVIYAIIIGFTMLYLYDTNNDAQTIVDKEAQQVSNLYYDAKWLPDSLSRMLQNDIKNYANIVLEKEWHAMTNGTAISNQGDLLLDKIRSDLNNNYFNIKDNIQIYTLRNVIDDARVLTNVRNERINLSSSALTADIWAVVLISSLLTVLFNYFFSTQLFLHFLVVSSITLLLASVFYILLLLDRPFCGPSGIKPEALQKVLLIMDKNTVKMNE